MLWNTVGSHVSDRDARHPRNCSNLHVLATLSEKLPPFQKYSLLYSSLLAPTPLYYLSLSPNPHYLLTSPSSHRFTDDTTNTEFFPFVFPNFFSIFFSFCLFLPLSPRISDKIDHIFSRENMFLIPKIRSFYIFHGNIIYID